jgi:hypothetical protein
MKISISTLVQHFAGFLFADYTLRNGVALVFA